MSSHLLCYLDDSASSPFWALALHPPHPSVQRELLTMQTPNPNLTPLLQDLPKLARSPKEPPATQALRLRPADSRASSPTASHLSFPSLAHQLWHTSPGCAGLPLAPLPPLTLCPQPSAPELLLLILESSSSSKYAPALPTPPLTKTPRFPCSISPQFHDRAPRPPLGWMQGKE